MDRRPPGDEPYTAVRHHPAVWTLAVSLALALALPCAVPAETFPCRAGDVACLVAAITAANANGQTNTIRLEAGTYTLTTPLTFADGLPIITSPLTLIGQGPDATILERAPTAPGFRLLHVTAPGSLTVTGVTLRGGHPIAPGAALFNDRGTLEFDQVIVVGNIGDDGGIVNFEGHLTITASLIKSNGGAHYVGGLENKNGTVSISQSTFLYNAADGAGAIQNNGTMAIAASTFLENSANNSGLGGAIYNSGTLDVVNSTFARNRLHAIFDDRDGTAIYNAGVLVLSSCTLAEQTGRNPFVGPHGSAVFSKQGATTMLHNTILARNTSEPGLQDCGGTVLSLGHNLIGDPTGCTITLLPSDKTGDPGLGTFTDTGQPGQGHYPLLPTSPAIAAGDEAACPPTDQLGRPRVGRCDIGAIQFQGTVPTPPVALVAQVRGDFNGDGVEDLAGLALDTSIYRCIAGETACTQLPGRAVELAACDWSRDGHTDLAALASDTRIFVMTDGVSWRQVPGRLRHLVARKLRSGACMLDGVAADSTLWESATGGDTWQQLPGRLRVMISGDFVGGQDEQLAGAGWDTSLWWYDSVGWHQLPGYLVTLEAVPGTPVGMRGQAYDGVMWIAHTLGVWERVPSEERLAQE